METYNDYIPIDIRKLKDKNRVYLSDDLFELLGKPDYIVFSKLNVNGDTKIVVNNAENKIKGEKLHAVKIDKTRRCTIPKVVRNEIGIDDSNKNNFVGFFLTGSNNDRVIELINIARIGKGDKR